MMQGTFHVGYFERAMHATFFEAAARHPALDVRKLRFADRDPANDAAPPQSAGAAAARRALGVGIRPAVSLAGVLRNL